MNQNVFVNALALVIGLILMGAIFFFGAIGFAIVFVIVAIAVFVRLVMGAFQRPKMRVYMRQTQTQNHQQAASQAHKQPAASAKKHKGKPTEVTDVELH